MNGVQTPQPGFKDKLRGIGAEICAAERLQDNVTLACPSCSGLLRVRPQHMQMPVACPHCRRQFEPRRVAAEQILPAGGVECGGTPTTYSWRNRWVAGVLGVLLGPLGVHRFYLGYTGIGVLQIVLSLCTMGIAGVWGFVEGILLLVSRQMRDVNGLPLRE